MPKNKTKTTVLQTRGCGRKEEIVIMTVGIEGSGGKGEGGMTKRRGKRGREER